MEKKQIKPNSQGFNMADEIVISSDSSTRKLHSFHLKFDKHSTLKQVSSNSVYICLIYQ